MSTPDRSRIEALFEAALELAPDSRPDFVAAACGEDDAMRDAVMALLAASDRSQGVLERDPRSLIRPADRPPDRLGVYRVLRELGRGGMGVVYDAERDDGQFRRRVAIKIIHGADDAELQQRVLAERQILAGLDHPHIARLLDGGVADDGRPYLVMEHVEGLPVSVYCDRMRLSIPERLRLFVTIARAVDFAHRNLVIHRDLKPSNVLVTPDGRVKLLDFGVAKLLNPWLSGANTQLTRDRAALTPEYASPEQIRGEALTTTTDVYSLGVMLYELLTGRRPHAAQEGDLASFLDAVCNADPERPSSRVLRPEKVRAGDGGETVLEPAAVARARDTTPQRLERLLRGDLDAIVGMALRTEPPRRYGSAELLAQDIERHLAGRPVRAHQGSRGYRLGKLIRRHRLQAAAVVVVALSLVGGAGGALWQARIATAEHDRAALAHAESDRVMQFLLELFEAGTPEASVAGAITARDLVERGVRRIGSLEDQPAVQAPLLAVLGRVLVSLADYDEAQRLTERALALYEAEGDEAGAARMTFQRGMTQRERGDYRAALESLLEARAMQLRVLGPGHPDLGPTYHDLAAVQVYFGEFEEAQRHADEAYGIQRASLGDAHRLTLNTLLLRGLVQRRRGLLDSAEYTIRRVNELRPQAAGSTRTEVLEDRLQLADLLQRRNADESERIYRDVLNLARATPEEVGVRAWVRSSLAALLSGRGDYAGAERLLRETYEERLSIYGPRHRAVAESGSGLGGVLLRAGRLDQAEELFRESAAVYRDILGERHLAYANALAQIADIHGRRGNHAAADSILAHAVALRMADEGPLAHGLPDLLRRRAEARIGLGDHAAAEEFLGRALSIAEERSYSAGVRRQIHTTFADLYAAWQKPEQAARHRALATP
ncbi:MAG TPA: serine/threonine-protein kinase [Longimicrobiales bacterium]|nr:serine/threonine-protein kinase [Longimicrobiales bacterium]